MSGAFVISLDFELMWGVRDHRTVQDYGDAVLGGRKAIPQILNLFDRHRIRATWATVGLLFARNRQEMLDYAPNCKPDYVNPVLSPYQAIATEIGRDEASDPYHFGRSLLDRIMQTEGQEIGTHTYSHYYCLEEGQSTEEFGADIAAAKAIAKDSGIDFRSIVFPRNQASPEAIQACGSYGIDCYRGNPTNYIDRPRKSGDQSLLVRGLRTVDSILPLTGVQCHNFPNRECGVFNVPASRFFCPMTSKLPLFSDLFLRRIETEMHYAATRNLIYHLWWHPHNFGRDTEANLRRLEAVLKIYERLANEYGMRSMAMGDFTKRETADRKPRSAP